MSDLGLFGPGTVTWRVHAEPVLLLSAPRALLLQALHPRAIAGVTQNSDFKNDPWGRLQRTINYVATVVYGTTAQAEAAGRRVRAVHAAMTARDVDTGEEFRLDEPDLLRWVHVTEVDSFVTTARRAGLELSDADVDRYYAEQRRAAELVGLDPATVPGTAAEVAAFYERHLPELHSTPEAREVMRFLVSPPLPYGLGITPVRVAWWGFSALGVGLLPRWARRMYSLPGLPTTDVSATASAYAVRHALRVLPRRAFEGPIFRSAMARAAKATAGPAEEQA
ncbi:oxygenase MpaB family protein [Hamadaea tsunoensis]|uniref:oxygenase MpaB family protein n=1 Tax=Hamadaea tsunoensis TaxID=53368 RepID=UPI00040E4F24|nr:oxygenase MpaB family protein [Hamadaea tsunoensis]